MNRVYKYQLGKKITLESDNTKIVNPNIQAILFDHQANLDLNDMSEADFGKKYNTSKHRFKYDKDVKYKNQVDADAKLSRERNGSIDYPSTDVRSKTFGGVPNMFFVTPNQQGTPLAKNLQEQTGEIVLSAFPIEKIPSLIKNELSLLKTKKTPAIFRFMDRSSLNEAGIPQTISEDKMLSKMKDIIETSESNAINYTNNPEYKNRFAKNSIRDGLNTFEQNPYQKSSTPVFVFDKNKNLQSISKYSLPNKKSYVSDLQKALDKNAGGFANESGIYIRTPSKTEVGLEKFALTMDHEMHHLDNYFFTPNKNSMPLGEAWKVSENNINYNDMIPDYHSYSSLFKDVIKNNKSWEASPAEVSAEIYSIKQKYGIGSNGKDLNDLEALKIYEKIPDMFRKEANKENIIKFIKLVPSIAGSMYLYERKK